MGSRAIRPLLLTSLALCLAATSCEPGSVGPAGGSQGANFIPPKTPHDPPWGLDKVALPADREALVGAFSALPRQILGVPWVESAGTCFACSSPCVSSAMQACYEQGSSLSFIRATRVRDLHWVKPRVSTVSAFFGQEVPSGFRLLGELEEFDKDPADGILWVGSKPDSSYGWYRFYWGEPHSGWIFDAWSGSDRLREALVKAFVQTLRDLD